MKTTTESAWNDIQEKHEMAYFKGQLATEFPESYAVEETKEIGDGMSASTAEVDAMLRADFREHAPVRSGQDARPSEAGRPGQLRLVARGPHGQGSRQRFENGIDLRVWNWVQESLGSGNHRLGPSRPLGGKNMKVKTTLPIGVPTGRVDLEDNAEE